MRSFPGFRSASSRCRWSQLDARALSAARDSHNLSRMMNSNFRAGAENGDTSNPLLAREISFLARYEIEEADTLRVQPCISPLWTRLSPWSPLEEAGLDPSHPALLAASRWLGRQSDPRARRLAGEESRRGARRMAFEFATIFIPTWTTPRSF